MTIKHSVFISIFLILFAIPEAVFSQEVKTDKKKILSNIDSLRIAKLDFGRLKFTPFIAPSYSPELEVLVSAGGLVTFKMQKNPLLERSSIPFSIGISSNGSVQFSAKFNLYGKDDKVRTVGEWWFKDMPDNYWGIGYDNGRNFDKGDSTKYQRRWWQLKQKIMFKVKPTLFVGPILDISSTRAEELNPRMANDAAVIEFGQRVRNSGLGFVIAHDSRDLAVNAYKGMYLDLSATFYGSYLRGEQDFQVYELDYRGYQQLGRERSTLAWNAKTRTTFGNVPWPELSQLGNPFDYRGYQWGRYRDEALILGVVEYRRMFQKKKLNKQGNYDSRFGFTTWTGAGSVGTDITDYSDWLPTFGLGLRFETQKRMNVRIDYGIGIESSSFYVITFNEAF